MVFSKIIWLFFIKTQVIYLKELWSNVEQKTPFSDEIEPGCTILWILWKLYPDFQSQKFKVPIYCDKLSQPA